MDDSDMFRVWREDGAAIGARRSTRGDPRFDVDEYV